MKLYASGSQVIIFRSRGATRLTLSNRRVDLYFNTNAKFTRHNLSMPACVTVFVKYILIMIRRMRKYNHDNTNNTCYATSPFLARVEFHPNRSGGRITVPVCDRVIIL